MRRFPTFLTHSGLALIAAFVLSGCSSPQTGIPDRRPGDFRLGVVVMTPDTPKLQTGSQTDSPTETLAGGDARYIIDSSSVLRASFGTGSTLDTFPGFTRRLTPDQMDAIWIMTQDLLKHNEHEKTLHAGQPQEMVGTDAGTIVEIHLNARDEVYVFDPFDQQAAAIVDALAALAWIDTTISTVQPADDPSN